MDDELRNSLFDAGAAGVRFNAPLGQGRADTLIDALGSGGASSIVDLGCGRGAFARIVAARLQNSRVVGIDSDEPLIAQARREAEQAGLGGRVAFEVADAAHWSGIVKAVTCIGASHIFGGPGDMFGHLASLAPGGVAIVGDGIWQAEPTGWCLTELGEMPRGVDELAKHATANGWSVESKDTSTLEEWDDFEHGWIGGVRSLGTPEANAFADSRQAEYQNYRGILGFAWLVLSRTS